VNATGDSTAVTATADLSVATPTIDAPDSATTGSPFNVSVSAVVHNAGPFTPVNANLAIDLEGSEHPAG
jgi:hypothetical protein